MTGLLKAYGAEVCCYEKAARDGLKRLSMNSSGPFHKSRREMEEPEVKWEL